MGIQKYGHRFKFGNADNLEVFFYYKFKLELTYKSNKKLFNKTIFSEIKIETINFYLYVVGLKILNEYLLTLTDNHLTVLWLKHKPS